MSSEGNLYHWGKADAFSDDDPVTDTRYLLPRCVCLLLLALVLGWVGTRRSWRGTAAANWGRLAHTRGKPARLGIVERFRGVACGIMVDSRWLAFLSRERNGSRLEESLTSRSMFLPPRRLVAVCGGFTIAEQLALARRSVDQIRKWKLCLPIPLPSR